MSSSDAAGGGDGAAAPGEEGILVAIRMRPLNARESSQNSKVWRALPKHRSVTQTTSSGKPLPERIIGRNFFTYDKAFGETTTTRQLYDATASGIVNSVANGLNGTIFAYGQTSSGKTFTMQGAGTIMEGASGSPRAMQENGGVVHMAACDIFDHIEKEPERVFLVRVSFIEIYNEEVRDLLVSGDGNDDATLTVREDKRRGVFVNSNETIVTNMESMLSVLFAGEKNRSVSATAMNERSSRSHTIFRITVESRPKDSKKKNESDNEMDEDSEDEEEAMMRGESTESTSAVRVSTLNLVDLAGSESVRHTGATGDRQKEGGKINQSLLTLSRVIGSLGQGAAHVNFRDSKLTRILQPSLSGNARMAVICCTTPSEMYTEETRSTLQFASRAKLVKTCAKVNEVVDDRSLIKKLQRELKEARQGGPGEETMEQMKALQAKAASAESAERKAEEDLRKMKNLILMGGGGLPGNISFNGGAIMVNNNNNSSSVYKSLFVYNDNDGTIKNGADNFSLSDKKKKKSKRRYSDGVINETENGNDPQLASFASPVRGGTVTKIQARTEVKAKRPKPTAHLKASDEVDISLLRDALAHKSAQAVALKAKLKKVEAKVKAEAGEKEMMRMEKQELRSQVCSLAEDKEFSNIESNMVMEEKDQVIATSLEKIEKMLEERRERASTASELEAMVESLQGQLVAKDADHENAIQMLNEQNVCQQEEVAAKATELEGKLEAVVNSNNQLMDRVVSLEGANESVTKLLAEKEAALEEAQTHIAALAEDKSTVTAQVTLQVTELQNEMFVAEERSTADLESFKLKEEAFAAQIKKSEEAVESLIAENAKAATGLEEVTAQNTTLLGEMESFRVERDTLQQRVESLDKLHEHVASLEDEMACVTIEKEQAEDQMHFVQADLERTTRLSADRTAALNEELENAHEIIHNASAEKCQLAENNAALVENIALLQNDLDHLHGHANSLEDDMNMAEEAFEDQLEMAKAQSLSFSEEIESLKSERDELQQTLSSKISELQNKLDDAMDGNESLTKKLKDAMDDLESKKAQLEGIDIDTSEVMKQLEHCREKSSADLDSFKLQEDTLRADIAKVEETVALLLSEKSEAIVHLEKAKAENDTLSGEVEELKTEYGKLQQQMESLDNRISEANDRADASAEELKTMTTQRDECAANSEKIIDNISAEKCRVQEELAAAYKQLADNDTASVENIALLQNDLDQLQGHANSLEADTKMAQEAAEALRNEKAQTDDQLEMAKAQSLTFSEEIESLKSERDELQQTLNSKISELQNKLDDAMDCNESLTKKLNDATNDFNTKNIYLEGLVHDKNEAMKQLELSQEKSHEGLDSFKLREETLRIEITKAEETVAFLLAEKAEATASLEKAAADYGTLSSEAEVFEMERDKIQKQAESWESQLRTAEDEIVRLTEESNASSQMMQDLQSDLSKEKENQASALQAVTQSLQSSADENRNLSSQLVDLQSKFDSVQSSSTDVVHELMANISKLEANTLEREQENTSSISRIAELENEVSTLSSERDELVEELSLKQEEVTSYSLKMDELQSTILQISTERDTLTSELESNTDTIAALESERDECLNEAELAITEKEKMVIDIDAVEAKHSETVEKITQEIGALKHQASEATLHITELTNQLSIMSTNKEELAAKIESTTYDLATIRDEADRQTATISTLESSIQSLTVDRDSANERVSKLLSGNTDAEKLASSLKTEKDQLASSLIEAKADITRLVTEKEEMATKLSALDDDTAKLNSQIDVLINDLGASKSQNEADTIRYNVIESELEQYKEKLKCVTEDNEELASELSNVEAKFNEKIATLEAGSKQKTEEGHSLNEAMALSNAQIAQLMTQVSALTQEKDALTKRVERATEDMSDMQSTAAALVTERNNAEAKAQEMLSSISKLDGEKTAIYSEKEALVAKIDECRIDAQVKINDLNANIVELQDRNESLVKDLGASKSEMNELLSQAEKSEANYEALELEKDKLSTVISDVEAKFKETIASLQKSIDSKSQEISQLNDQLTSLNIQIANAPNDDSDAVDSLKKEIIELKSLLSSANSSVDEARSAAISAEEELEEKEIQLEDALRNLAEHEESRRIAEDKLRLAELSPRNSPSRTDSEEELLRDMEVLMGEKIDAESRLEQELNRQTEAEDEIRKAAEEEKQLLMDDAEERMISLRDEISQLKADLSRVESDCYSMKDENTDLHDKIKRAETKAVDSEGVVISMRDELSREKYENKELQDMLQSLEEQSASFKSQVFAAKETFEAESQAKLDAVIEELNDALSQLAKSRSEANLRRGSIEDLNRDIEEYRKELDSIKGVASNEKDIELSKLREELAQAKLDLSHSEADCLSANRERDAAKEKVDRTKRREHEKHQKLAEKARVTIESLTDKLAKAESALKNFSTNNMSREEVDHLQAEVNELKSTIRNKDERIKKLEKSKITKAQIAGIKELRDGKNQFEAQAKELQQRLQELESNPPRALRERNDSSNDQSKVIAKLRDDLRQCERKLKKYVQHSERLESDRQGVLKVMKDVGGIVGDSAMEMVSSLCDKLVSIEEECDALATSEGKAAEYLRELDSLREKHAALELQAQSHNLNKVNLKNAQEKISALLKDKDSLQTMAQNTKKNMTELQNEQRRQMQYLERENLQLGEDLKKTKKVMAETKAELDSIQENAFSSEETVELQGLGNAFGQSVSRRTSESASKRSLLSGSKRIPLGSSRKRCSDSPNTKEAEIGKENLLNKKQRTLSSSIKSPFGSVKKKRSNNPLSSVKKAARRTRRALTDDSPTKKEYVLGDSEPTEDVTSECNQS